MAKNCASGWGFWVAVIGVILAVAGYIWLLIFKHTTTDTKTNYITWIKVLIGIVLLMIIVGMIGMAMKKIPHCSPQQMSGLMKVE